MGPQRSQPPQRRRSPWIPTPLESILLAIYPGTLLLGSLFSLLDPAARSAPYDAATNSHPAHLAPSYFAQKHNLFNVLFVKIGWLWISSAFVVFLFTHGGPPAVLTPRRVQALVRFSLVTAWWVAVTKWFFGPPLMDRTFVLTGGACEGDVAILTGAACKVAGGRWNGGHDISGHVFLLVLGSTFLWMEVLYVALLSSGVPEERSILTGRDGTEVKSADVERVPGDEAKDIRGIPMLAFRLALVVLALSWFMLFMTAAYFHTWVEKVWSISSMLSRFTLTTGTLQFAGLGVALSGIFVVYYLPRTIPAMRHYVGLPGV